jgi:hypothetical protein
MPKEEVLLVASQSKVAPGGSISSPDRIYITTSRVLFKDPKMFGLRANITAIKYEDIATVMLKRGVFSTEILLKPRASLQHIDLPAVDKQVAVQVSSLIQKGMRGELASRKAAPLLPKQESGAELRPGPEKPKMDALDRLERLALMKHQGIITEEEFGILKEELMLDIRPQISGETVIANGQSQRPQEREQKIEPRPATAGVAVQKEAEKPKEESTACRYCGFATISPAAKFCHDCGKDLKAETNVWKMCPACDALTTNDAAFCSSCREKFPETLS